MSDWQRAQVEINQHQISYLRTGGDELKELVDEYHDAIARNAERSLNGR